MVTASNSVTAHEGHGDGPPESAVAVEAMPRASAQSETYELVAVLNGDALVVYLDRYTDNRPVTNADLDITIGATTARAARLPDGTFRIQAAELLRPGRHELVFAVRGEAGDDLLIAVLESRQQAIAGESKPAGIAFAAWPSTAMLTLAGGLSFLAIAVSTVRLGLGRAIMLGLVILVGTLLAGILPVPAHEGHDEPKPSQGLLADSPRRLPDASVFLPKLSQRLLAISTIIAEETPHQPARSWIGRIIPDPNASGLVQSTIGGRVKPANGGLPSIGQVVKAGDVLCYVQPPFAAIDQTQVAQTAGDLDQQIALVQTKLERAKRLYAANAGTRVALEEADIQLRGLEKRRAALRASEVKPEPLYAPVSGTIAVAKVVTGQVVASQDVLFQIIDPARLWVEAFVFDSLLGAEDIDATGAAQEGVTFGLSLIGRSRALQQQSMILHFRIIDPPTTLNVGTPVRVMAHVGQPVKAIVVPKAALVRASNGDSQLWLHTAPEQFVARPVRVSAFDGESVLVLSGLKPGERVVIDGAELVNQVR